MSAFGWLSGQAFTVLGQHVPRQGQFPGRPPDRMGRHQVSGSLSERAGGKLQAQRGDTPFPIKDHVGDHAAAAQGGAHVRRAFRLVQPPEMRNGRRQPQDRGIVERRVHFAAAALAGSGFTARWWLT